MYKQFLHFLGRPVVKLTVSIRGTVSSFSSGAVEWYTLQANFYI